MKKVFSVIGIYFLLCICGALLDGNKVFNNAFQALEKTFDKDADDVSETEVASTDTASTEAEVSSTLSIDFVDVGQGDCSIIIDGEDCIVIDTGYWDAYETINASLQDLNVDNIDALVLTHPDADHIGSAEFLIDEWDVDKCYMTEKSSDSKTYKYLMQAIEESDTSVVYPSAGDTLDLGSANYTFVGPCELYDDSNSCSLVLKVEHGENSFLFTGDMTGEEYEDIIASGYDLSATVIKCPHHGSANDGCNCSEMYERGNFQYAIISCGENNRYGHPHEETMSLLKQYDINVFRTDKQGSFFVVSDGDELNWSIAPTTDLSDG